jgi:hypothetical protein
LLRRRKLFYCFTAYDTRASSLRYGVSAYDTWIHHYDTEVNSYDTVTPTVTILFFKTTGTTKTT